MSAFHFYGVSGRFRRLRVALLAFVFVAMIVKTPTGAAPNAAGGSNEMRAVEGCAQTWLFDGIWRFRVTSVTEGSDPSGAPAFVVSFTLRNGTNTKLDVSGSSVNTNGSYALADDDGNTIAPTDVGDTSAVSALSVTGMLPASSISTKLYFPRTGSVTKPTKVLLSIDKNEIEKIYSDTNVKLHYAADPNFRVRLSCPH